MEESSIRNIVIIDDQTNGKYRFVNKKLSWATGTVPVKIDENKAKELINKGEVDIIIKGSVLEIESLLPIARGDIRVGIISEAVCDRVMISIEYGMYNGKCRIIVHRIYKGLKTRAEIGIDTSIAEWVQLICLNRVIGEETFDNCEYSIAINNEEKEAKADRVYASTWGGWKEENEYDIVWEDAGRLYLKPQICINKMQEGYIVSCIKIGTVGYIHVGKDKIKELAEKALNSYKGKLIK